MAHLMSKSVSPKSIAYLTGDVIANFKELIQLITDIQGEMTPGMLRYVIVDEITSIHEWDRGVKFLADTGQLAQTCLFLSGSDLVLLSDARMRFPGRRGENDTVDFHVYPLSFREYVHLSKESNLSQAYQSYMIHGGYIRAINEWHRGGDISRSAFKTYSDWIIGDALKRGKNEAFLLEILQAILKIYLTQVSWISLSQHTSIEHGNTVQNYVELLQSMDALFIQQALLEHKLLPAPKKAKRLLFSDPFIYHSVAHLIFPHWNHLDLSPEYQSALTETIVINHFRRQYPCYYIKAEGEVDLAYVHDGTFHPIEIKWTSQLRSRDLKQIRKYPNGIVWANVKEAFTHEGLSIVPLIQALYGMG
jgi:predicted AAA+ superfamily ATPase